MPRITTQIWFMVICIDCDSLVHLKLLYEEKKMRRKKNTLASDWHPCILFPICKYCNRVPYDSIRLHNNLRTVVRSRSDFMLLVCIVFILSLSLYIQLYI